MGSKIDRKGNKDKETEIMRLGAVRASTPLTVLVTEGTYRIFIPPLLNIDNRLHLHPPLTLPFSLHRSRILRGNCIYPLAL